MQAAQQAVLRVKGVGENRGRGGVMLYCVYSRGVLMKRGQGPLAAPFQSEKIRLQLCRPVPVHGVCV